MISDCQRPRRRIMLVSTRAHRRAMAPPARKDRAWTSLGRNPRCGPRMRAEDWRRSVISAEVTGRHRTKPPCGPELK